MTGNDQQKVSYETPVVLDHGSISDHTFRQRCIVIPRRRKGKSIRICFPGGGGGGLS